MYNVIAYSFSIQGNNLMANIKTVVRNALVSGVAAQAGVNEAEAILNQKRDGMYTCGIKAAIAAKSADTFTEVLETLENDFRFNRRGIAEKYNVPQAKMPKTGKAKTDKDGNPIYIVPSSLRTMKTWVLKGFKYGVDFGTASKPTPFSVVRAACAAAQEEAAKAERTPDDEARDVIREVLGNIATSLDSVEGKRALTASLKLVQELASAIEKQAA
jgi:limonene-1,2-epoxide hydrolase